MAIAQSCHLLFELLTESLQITHSGVVFAGVVGRQCRHPFLHHKIQSSQRCTIVVGMPTKATQSGRMVLMYCFWLVLHLRIKLLRNNNLIGFSRIMRRLDLDGVMADSVDIHGDRLYLIE